MARFQAFLLLAFTLVTSLASARAEEKPPVQEPQLRIEAGMHVAIIKGVSVSRDGRLLVTGSDDKTVRLWSLPKGRLLRTFRVPIGPGDGGKIYAVAISPDGRLIAAGGWDAYSLPNGGGKQHVYLFDTVSGAVTARLGPLSTTVNDLVFSADGQKLAAGLGGWPGEKHGIRVWTAPFTAESLKDSDYTDAVYGIAFDQAGRLATASYDRAVRLYDPQLKLITQTMAPLDKPYGVDFSPDSQKLAISYRDSTQVDVLDASKLKPLFSADTPKGGDGNLAGLAWSSNGETLYAGGRWDQKGVHSIFAWAEAGRSKARMLGGPLNTVRALSVWPPGGVAFGSAEPAFGLFDADGKFVKVPDGRGDEQDYRGPVTADMRIKRSGNFWSARDATHVWFGLKQAGEDPWLFDVAKLTFEAAPLRPADSIEPATNTLKIEHWMDPQPTLNGRDLKLEPYEFSRSLAIAPDARSFTLGAEWSIIASTPQASKSGEGRLREPPGA